MQAYCEHGCRQAAHERREQLRGVASLAEAITAATIRDLDGQKHSHQRRIKPAILEQANRTLQLHAGELAAAGSFHELFCLIEDLMQPITGIGALAVYDFTERIAGYLERAPSVVYLHAGTREGAKALGLDTPAGV